MGKMNLNIYGRDYGIACDDGQEAHLGHLGQMVNERATQLAKQMGRGSESLMLIYTALMLADELEESRSHVKQLQEKLNADPAQTDLVAESSKLAEMESAMAETMDQIAARIEKLAGKMQA